MIRSMPASNTRLNTNAVDAPEIQLYLTHMAAPHRKPVRHADALNVYGDPIYYLALFDRGEWHEPLEGMDRWMPVFEDQFASAPADFRDNRLPLEKRLASLKLRAGILVRARM